MPTLTITRGLPGSGKSTWAKAQPGLRVNRDDQRRMLFGDAFPHGDRIAEDLITEINVFAISRVLMAGRDVICDDTNLPDAVVAMLTRTATRYGAAHVVVDFRDVPVAVCLDRDAARPQAEQVGREVILGMAERWLTRGDR
ncbi:hypothetical protein Cme02nite_20800 [Catellatospora methionotrophica]|uniref:AAA family ATPase n=1 Tax=Catellatospora methionotrophica TaxID=121620 RepID=A0A8J3L3M2_9ACTN|nr:AAA family ATPase [Catellatospora methionotrophica]GIG13748.1 hypothetical protein Cme02nite_20800 [Catellatospora methionotrophica]